MFREVSDGKEIAEIEKASQDMKLGAAVQPQCQFCRRRTGYVEHTADNEQENNAFSMVVKISNHFGYNGKVYIPIMTCDFCRASYIGRHGGLIKFREDGRSYQTAEADFSNMPFDLKAQIEEKYCKALSVYRQDHPTPQDKQCEKDAIRKKALEGL